MKHRLILIASAALVSSVLVAGATAGAGQRQNRGQVFSFSGELLVAAGPNASTLSVKVETGNSPALRTMINASQNQVFAIGSGTRILIYSNGVPRVGATADLEAGNWVTIVTRAPFGSSLQQIENLQATTVTESAPPHAALPLWLFSGTVAGPQSGGTIALHVGSGNWRGLQAMLGQSLDQTFTYSTSTIFLLWRGSIPTVIDPSQLKAGDQITIRIRAPWRDSLAQAEATPAAHIGDHEPAAPPTS